MSTHNKKDKDPDRLIAANKRARYEYFIEDSYEAGLMLEGWEVKSLREGRAQITEAYVIIKKEEASARTSSRSSRPAPTYSPMPLAPASS